MKTVGKWNVLVLFAAFAVSATAQAAEGKLLTLKELVATTTRAARAQNAGAKPFEMSFPLNLGIASVGIPWGNVAFVVPGNDVKFLSVTRSDQGTEVNSLAYLRVGCGGAPRPDCGQETGSPEAESRHPALSGLRIDVADILKRWKAADDDAQLNVYVSTPARIANRGLTGLPLDAASQGSIDSGLRRVPAARAVVFVYRGRDGMKLQFLLLDGATGAVLAEGVAQQVAPPPGAVSSGS